MDHPRRVEQRGFVGVVHGVVAVDEVVAHAGALPCPVLVEAGDGEEVGDIYPADEVARLADEPLEPRDGAHVDGSLLVGIDRRGHATDEEALKVRVLASQHGVHLDKFALPVERLQIVGDGHEVGLGGELVGRMTPVGIGERPQLAAFDEPRQPRPHPREVALGRKRPVRDRLREVGGLGRIGLEGGDEVDPVERVQVVEVDDVILHALRRHDEVAQQTGVGRRASADGVLDGADGSDGVHGRAHAADPLGERPGVARIPPLENDLDAAEHGAGGPGLLDGSAVDLRLDAEVPLDARHGIDDDMAHDGSPSFRSGSLGLLSLRLVIWTSPCPANAAPTPATAIRPSLSMLAASSNPGMPVRWE